MTMSPCISGSVFSLAFAWFGDEWKKYGVRGGRRMCASEQLSNRLRQRSLSEGMLVKHGRSKWSSSVGGRLMIERYEGLLFRGVRRGSK